MYLLIRSMEDFMRIFEGKEDSMAVFVGTMEVTRNYQENIMDKVLDRKITSYTVMASCRLLHYTDQPLVRVIEKLAEVKDGGMPGEIEKHEKAADLRMEEMIKLLEGKGFTVYPGVWME